MAQIGPDHVSKEVGSLSSTRLSFRLSHSYGSVNTVEDFRVRNRIVQFSPHSSRRFLGVAKGGHGPPVRTLAPLCPPQ